MTTKSKRPNGLEFIQTLGLIQGLPRSPLQIHQAFEADCEILKFKNLYWSFSTDSIGEEIDQGLYQDPYQWGWMTVMSSVSDLAATGSKPLGLLLANQWKYKTTKKTQKRFFDGVRKALLASKVPLLGGDSGFGASHCHTSTIIGVSQKKPLTRLNVKNGDLVCLVGKRKTGDGPSLALSSLFSQISFSQKKFLPQPPIQIMQKLAPLSHAAIDTSDGIATSLALLSQLNGVGMDLQWRTESLSRQTLKLAEKNKIHPLFFWLSDLGDLQTLICVPPRNIKKALRICPDLLPIGRITRKHQDLIIRYGNKIGHFPVETIINTPRNREALIKTVRGLNKELFHLF